MKSTTPSDKKSRCWAFSYYLYFYFFIGSLHCVGIPGWTKNNALPVQRLFVVCHFVNKSKFPQIITKVSTISFSNLHENETNNKDSLFTSVLSLLVFQTTKGAGFGLYVLSFSDPAGFDCTFLIRTLYLFPWKLNYTFSFPQ